jgi:hypothetical protein
MKPGDHYETCSRVLSQQMLVLIYPKILGRVRCTLRLLVPAMRFSKEACGLCRRYIVQVRKKTGASMGCNVIGRGYSKWGYQRKQWEIEWDGTDLTIKGGYVWGQSLSKTHKTKYELGRLGPSNLGCPIFNPCRNLNESHRGCQNWLNIWRPVIYIHTIRRETCVELASLYPFEHILSTRKWTVCTWSLARHCEQPKMKWTKSFLRKVFSVSSFAPWS